jgi:hypothetical protein
MTEIKSPGEPQGMYLTLRRLVEAPTGLLLPPLPSYLTSPHQHNPTGFCPLQLIPGEGGAHVHFR